MNARLAVIAIAALSLASACSDARPAQPSATPAQTARGTLLVYSEAIREIATATRTTPVWRIATYDVDAGQELAAFEAGSTDDVPVTGELSGERVIVIFEGRVASYVRDGSDERELYRAPADGYVVAGNVSHDGNIVALSVQTSGLCPTTVSGGSIVCRPYAEVTSLFTLDAEHGDALLHVPQSDPRFAAFRGQLAPITWRDDNLGFMVQEYTHSEAPGGLALVMLDGRVILSPDQGYAINVSPNGRYISSDDWAPCDLSLFAERHRLQIRDVESNRVLAETVDPVLNIAPLEWSPNGEELLYRTAELEPGPASSTCKVERRSTMAWHILRAGGGATVDVAGVLEARRNWYGRRLLEYRCNAESALEPFCASGDGLSATFDVLNQGRIVTTAREFRVLGFIN